MRMMGCPQTDNTEQVVIQSWKVVQAHTPSIWPLLLLMVWHCLCLASSGPVFAEIHLRHPILTGIGNKSWKLVERRWESETLRKRCPRSGGASLFSPSLHGHGEDGSAEDVMEPTTKRLLLLNQPSPEQVAENWTNICPMPRHFDHFIKEVYGMKSHQVATNQCIKVGKTLSERS